jgi:hypothetical protein
MFQRMVRAMKYAAKEEHFAAVAGAAIFLILIGTSVYSLGEGWNVLDGFYFAICTLTTSSIADPNLVLTHEWLKIFTAIYVLTGIGILVELASARRRVCEERGARHARQLQDPPETRRRVSQAVRRGAHCLRRGPGAPRAQGKHDVRSLGVASRHRPP